MSRRRFECFAVVCSTSFLDQFSFGVACRLAAAVAAVIYLASLRLLPTSYCGDCGHGCLDLLRFHFALLLSASVEPLFDVYLKSIFRPLVRRHGLGSTSQEHTRSSGPYPGKEVQDVPGSVQPKKEQLNRETATQQPPAATTTKLWLSCRNQRGALPCCAAYVALQQQMQQ